ncbi:hypothetical protein [Salinibacter altiplanensis]|uniref:hypothetical protein n=1 Tax=Salinibacter altiplanensis TaxID=1803181 RepID=UPI000C9F5D62|nr:hypothetical protein [Salinibacter altiplanensis]
MKIFDTFLFSEPYESDVLWVKLNLESRYVDKWIICENEYTFQGEHKGLHARKVIESQRRFDEFRDRVRIIESSWKPPEIHDKKGVYDELAFESEYRQREMARDFALEELPEEGWLMISDCDECLDTLNHERVERLRNKLKKENKVANLPRKRFWFDYDMLWVTKRHVPIVSKSFLSSTEKKIGRIREDNITSPKCWDKPLVFEYSFCYNQGQINKKYDSQSHTGFTKKEIEKGIKCAHVPVSNLRNGSLTSDPRYWLEKSNLDKTASPGFVRQNFQSLETNVVPENYWTNRFTHYPQLWFNPIFIVKFIVKRIYISLPCYIKSYYRSLF